MSGTTDLRDTVGICQWFHYLDHESVERSIDLLHELNVKHLRTDLSWANFHRPEGQAWYDWLLPKLAKAGLEILLCVWHTPPSIAEEDKTRDSNYHGNPSAIPPRRLRDYADFIDQVIDCYGAYFSALELWNEPNNHVKWAREYDPEWKKFTTMASAAAATAKRRDKQTVLGGIAPGQSTDSSCLAWLLTPQLAKNLDAVGVHFFPGMDRRQFCLENGQPYNSCWQPHWRGWQAETAHLRQFTNDQPLWVTEFGHATAPPDIYLNYEQEQVRWIAEAVAAVEQQLIQRLYVYSLLDLDQNLPALTPDPLEHHMGLVKRDGYKKLAFAYLKQLLHI